MSLRILVLNNLLCLFEFIKYIMPFLKPFKLCPKSLQPLGHFKPRQDSIREPNRCSLGSWIPSQSYGTHRTTILLEKRREKQGKCPLGITLLNSTANENCLFCKFNLSVSCWRCHYADVWLSCLQDGQDPTSDGIGLHPTPNISLSSSKRNLHKMASLP